MQSLWQDLRYGMRGIRGNPGFSLLAVLTLALGIGAGTTMFSVIKNVLLSPFPYKDATRIAAFGIHDLDSARPGGRGFLKPAEYLEYRQQNHVFSGDTGGGNEDVLWTTGEGTERLDGGYVTPDTFQFLGVAAQVGRGIAPEDGKPGAPPVFVMSYKVWQTRFNLDPGVLGRIFVLNNTPTTLVGIMPEALHQARVGQLGGDLPTGQRGLLPHASNPIGLLNPVRREIWAVDRNVALTMTRTLDDFLSDFSYAQPRFLLAVLGVFAGVGLVLVAVGVYSVIAYTVSRQTHEIGIRMALGASRGDVIGMVLRMGMWLVGIGLAVGLAASLAANKVLASELWGVSARDPLTFGTVALVVLAAGVAACWFPARRATRVDPVIALRFE